MEKRLLSGVALLVAFCSLASAPLSAQLQTGRLLGTVLDEQHAAVPGATVTVTNLATNISRRVTSDGEGNYVVTPLEPGIYRISASLPGFQTTVRDRVELTVGQSARVELTLALGALSTDLVVTAKAPLLNTESATLGHVITNTQIVDLPLNGRSFNELARLTPGAALLPPTAETCRRVRPEIRERQHHRRRRAAARRVPARRRRHHRAASGRHVHPDVGRRAAGVQRPAERLFGGVPRRWRHVQRHHQVRLESPSTAAPSSSCATTRWTRRTSSPRRREARSAISSAARWVVRCLQQAGPSSSPATRGSARVRATWSTCIVPTAAQRAGDFSGAGAGSTIR